MVDLGKVVVFRSQPEDGGMFGTATGRSLAGAGQRGRDSISYLAGVARGKFKPSGLSSLENNVIVIEILDAARESARTGRTITLPR